MNENHSSNESPQKLLNAILSSKGCSDLQTMVDIERCSFNNSVEFLLGFAAKADWQKREKIIGCIFPFVKTLTLARKQLSCCIDSVSQMLGEAYGFFWDKAERDGTIRSNLWQLLTGLIGVENGELKERLNRSTTEKIAFAISVAEENLFDKYARYVAVRVGHVDDRIASSLTENVTNRLTYLQRAKQQLELSNIESLGKIGPKSIQQIDVPVIALLDHAEEACDRLGMVLTVDPKLWNKVNRARKKDKYLMDGVPWDDSANGQDDDWLVSPAELEDFETGFAVDICCVAANAICKIDPSSKAFWKLCESRQKRRSPQWRPLGWITSIPEFEIETTKKRELFRKEFEHFLSPQQWGHYPKVICEWISCSGQLDFVFQLQLVELMLDIQFDSESVDLLFRLLATTGMEPPMSQELARTIKSIDEKIVGWIEKYGDYILDWGMFELACDNYLMGEQIPEQFATAFLLALENKHIDSANPELICDIKELVKRAKEKSASANPD